jgi:hypothetical protein
MFVSPSHQLAFDLIGRLRLASLSVSDERDIMQQIANIEIAKGSTNSIALTGSGLFIITHYNDADLERAQYANVTPPTTRVARLFNGFVWSNGGVCTFILNGVMVDLAQDQHVAHMLNLLVCTLDSRERAYMLPVCVFDQVERKHSTRCVGWSTIDVERFVGDMIINRIDNNNTHAACYDALKQQVVEQNYQRTVPNDIWIDAQTVCTVAIPAPADVGERRQRFMYETDLYTDIINITSSVQTVQYAFAQLFGNKHTKARMVSAITAILSSAVPWNDNSRNRILPIDASDRLETLLTMYANLLTNDGRNFRWVRDAIDRTARPDANVQVLLDHLELTPVRD